MVLEIVVASLLALCVLMSCIPTMPGLPLMFLITIVYGFVDGFAHLSLWHFVVFGGIVALSMVIDTFSGVLGAKLGGASRKALLAGVVGVFVGLLLFPPLGAFLGLFAGVFVAEVAQFKNFLQAFKKASVSLAAAVAGTVANVMLAIGYVVLYVVFVW